jgi:carbonic anhydrase
MSNPDGVVSRRTLFAVAGAAAAATTLGACGSSNKSAVIVPSEVPVTTEDSRPDITDPNAALARLKEGNARFVAGRMVRPEQSPERRMRLSAGQRPFAVVLCCSDSRVPPEVIFDQGLGDLFVVRVAGNIVDDAGLGSIEYAIEHLDTPLIVVLGHEKCGAVSATLDALQPPFDRPHGEVDSLVDAITPAVEEALKQPGDLLKNAVLANIAHSRDLIKGNAELNPYLASGAVKIATGYYSLTDGTAPLS